MAPAAYGAQTGPGQTVLVHSAAGGVGIVAVQIAKAAGARVIGTVSNASKAAVIKEYGADDAIDYVANDFAVEANRITGGRGVDLILDAVGATTMDKGLTCLAPFGHLILYGRAGGPPEPLNLFRLFEKSTKVSGFTLYTVAAVPDLMRRGIEESFKLIARGQAQAAGGQVVPVRAGGRGAQIHGVAAIDGQAGADSVARHRTVPWHFAYAQLLFCAAQVMRACRSVSPDFRRRPISGNLQLDGNLQLISNFQGKRGSD